MDKFFETKKQRGLIFTEAHLKRRGSPFSMMQGNYGNITAPYFNAHGPIQWDRQKNRYRTFEEQEEYVRQCQAAANRWPPELLARDSHGGCKDHRGAYAISRKPKQTRRKSR